LALGFTLTYLSLIVLIPLAALVLKAASLGFSGFWDIVTEPRTLAALRVSFVVSFIAAVINVVFGVIVAWVLIRYRFPGRRLLDAIVDLPFALPTAVAGIALTAIYARNGWIGSWLDPFGIKIAYTPWGIGVALVFIGLPFVVRTVQPVLAELDREVEEAAASLGASRVTTFRRIILPALAPAIAAGAALSFARAVSEYGSLVLLSGNLPLHTEVTSVRILSSIENDNLASAAAVATILLAISLAVILAIDVIQRRVTRRG
jgi:sulfate transport system permease protein